MTSSASWPSAPAVASPAAAPYLAVVEPVVRVALDAPVRQGRPDRVPATPVDPERLAELAQRWALGGTAERLVAALAVAGS